MQVSRTIESITKGLILPLRTESEHHPRNTDSASTDADLQPPLTKKRKLSDRLTSTLASRYHRSLSTMDGAAQPIPSAYHRDWTPIDVHHRRAHVFAQTGTLLSLETQTLYVTSSRGFGRELPPTALTRPSLTTRRYTIDASLAPGVFQQERDYSFNNYTYEKEDFTHPIQTRSERLNLEHAKVSVREIDEPLQRRVQLPLSDPLRYRELHRWGHIRPPINDETYLCIGNASLTNDDFHTIVDHNGDNCWYRDSVLDTALELISLCYDGEANGIAVASSFTAQCVHFAGLTTDDAVLNELREYKAMFEDKKWIFIPLNDGMVSTSAEQAQGHHWALLAIDRPNLRAHYIDSLYKYDRGWQNLAWTFTCAIANLLDEKYTFRIECHAPHQWYNNRYRGTDGGPCGPYVLKMVQKYMHYIRYAQVQGYEEQINLILGSEMPRCFQEEFNSLEERWSLLYTLASVKASQVANDRVERHDGVALGKPRPCGIVEIQNSAPLLYDAPLFDKHASTYQHLHRHRIRSLHQRNMSLSSKFSSGSSGGVILTGEPSGTCNESGYAGTQDDRDVNQVEMYEQPAPTTGDGDNEVRIEEILDYETPQTEDADWLNIVKIFRSSAPSSRSPSPHGTLPLGDEHAEHCSKENPDCSEEREEEEEEDDDPYLLYREH